MTIHYLFLLSHFQPLHQAYIDLLGFLTDSSEGSILFEIDFIVLDLILDSLTRMWRSLSFSILSYIIIIIMAARIKGNFLKKFMHFPNIKKPQVAPFETEKITIPNTERFLSKLNALRQQHQSIQFISDFDYTISKFRHAGRQCDSLFGMWVRGQFLPTKFKQALISNYSEFGPYETDASIPFEDRSFLVNQLYKNQLKTFQRFRITEEMVEKVLNNSYLVYRSHTTQFLDMLQECNVPLYIISGGISDSIYNFIYALTEKQYPNISIHSNQLDYYTYSMPDDAAEFDPRFIKFKKNIIHSFNKFKVMNHLDKRKNCVIMGDLVSDIYMAEGNGYDTVLSVFYGKEGQNDQRALAEKKFDIIVEGDSSHRILVQLLKVIYKKPGIDWRYLESTNSSLHHFLM